MQARRKQYKVHEANAIEASNSFVKRASYYTRIPDKLNQYLCSLEQYSPITWTWEQKWEILHDYMFQKNPQENKISRQNKKKLTAK